MPKTRIILTACLLDHSPRNAVLRIVLEGATYTLDLLFHSTPCLMGRPVFLNLLLLQAAKLTAERWNYVSDPRLLTTVPFSLV
jgi:hypothetical protein